MEGDRPKSRVRILKFRGGYSMVLDASGATLPTRPRALGRPGAAGKRPVHARGRHAFPG